MTTHMSHEITQCHVPISIGDTFLHKAQQGRDRIAPRGLPFIRDGAVSCWLLGHLPCPSHAVPRPHNHTPQKLHFFSIIFHDYLLMCCRRIGYVFPPPPPSYTLVGYRHYFFFLLQTALTRHIPFVSPMVTHLFLCFFFHFLSPPDCLDTGPLAGGAGSALGSSACQQALQRHCGGISPKLPRVCHCHGHNGHIYSAVFEEGKAPVLLYGGN